MVCRLTGFGVLHVGKDIPDVLRENGNIRQIRFFISVIIPDHEGQMGIIYNGHISAIEKIAVWTAVHSRKELCCLQGEHHIFCRQRSTVMPKYVAADLQIPAVCAVLIHGGALSNAKSRLNFPGIGIHFKKSVVQQMTDPNYKNKTKNFKKKK